MNIHEVGEIRRQYGLEHVPKIERRKRVVLVMQWMLCHAERFSLEDVREVVGGSDSSWQRAKAWYREERGLRPDEPLIPGPLDRGMSEITTVINPWQRRMRELETAQAARRVRTTGTSWSFLRDRRERPGNVIGPDVGHPVSDYFYARWQERREANRARVRKELLDA